MNQHIMIETQVKSKNHTSIVESCILLPAIFIQNGRQQFRKEFIRNYPSFIHLLRNLIPQITPSEEILAMLIALGQNIDEAAEILCIEKKSVRMTRYRIRKKIGMEKDKSLDELIRSFL